MSFKDNGGGRQERTNMACHSSRIPLSSPSVSSYDKPWIAKCGAGSIGLDAYQLRAENDRAASLALLYPQG